MFHGLRLWAPYNQPIDDHDTNPEEQEGQEDQGNYEDHAGHDQEDQADYEDHAGHDQDNQGHTEEEGQTEHQDGQGDEETFPRPTWPEWAVMDFFHALQENQQPTEEPTEEPTDEPTESSFPHSP